VYSVIGFSIVTRRAQKNKKNTNCEYVCITNWSDYEFVSFNIILNNKFDIWNNCDGKNDLIFNINLIRIHVHVGNFYRV